jgi:hypothetical protein
LLKKHVLQQKRFPLPPAEIFIINQSRSTVKKILRLRVTPFPSLVDHGTENPGWLLTVYINNKPCINYSDGIVTEFHRLTI